MKLWIKSPQPLCHIGTLSVIPYRFVRDSAGSNAGMCRWMMGGVATFEQTTSKHCTQCAERRRSRCVMRVGARPVFVGEQVPGHGGAAERGTARMSPSHPLMPISGCWAVGHRRFLRVWEFHQGMMSSGESGPRNTPVGPVPCQKSCGVVEQGIYPGRSCPPGSCI
jgi:hypothetical protein